MLSPGDDQVIEIVKNSTPSTKAILTGEGESE